MICGRGGVGVLWVVVVLWLSDWPPFHLLIPVDGQPTLQCVQVGQSLSGYHSIGAKRFTPIHSSLGSSGRDNREVFDAVDYWHYYYYASETDPNRDTWHKRTCASQGWRHTWPSKYNVGFSYIHLDVDFCDRNINISTYLVQQHGKVLRGWLHFEVEYTETKGMQFIYAQVRDENWNAIGEFVPNENGQLCNSTKPGTLISPTKYQILPCTATSPQEAKTSQAIFMAKTSAYKDRSAVNGYIPSQDLKKGIHFLWRLDEYWCNRHEKFRLDVHVLPTANVTTFNRLCPPTQYTIDDFKKELYLGCRQRRKTTPWIHPKWFGAADIKLDGQLNCTERAFDNYGNLTQAASAWINETTTLTVGSDYVGHEIRGVCQILPYSVNYPSFGGRCTDYYTRISALMNVSQDTTHRCITNDTSPRFEGTQDFVSYTDYQDQLFISRTQKCSSSSSSSCRVPSFHNDTDLKAIQGFPKKNVSAGKGKISISYKVVENARTEQRANTLFFTRKYHGNLCILTTMFLIPVSNFVIRYYKETFMHHLSLGCAPWFWVHMLICFVVPTLYLSGHASMEQSMENFGTSESAHAEFHRDAGKLFVIVFVLMVAFGAFRPLIRGGRMISMTVHAVTGFLLYFLAIGLIVNSTFIPASPTLAECDSDGLPTGFSFTAWMAIGWLLIDLAFHFLLTVFQFAIDRQHEIVRAGFGLPIIPLLPAEASRDLVGARFRKLVLLVYVILSLGMTLTTMVALFRNDDQGKCILGEMSCNLSEIRPGQESSPFGCSKAALKYYERVLEKYAPKLEA